VKLNDKEEIVDFKCDFRGVVFENENQIGLNWFDYFIDVAEVVEARSVFSRLASSEYDESIRITHGVRFENEVKRVNLTYVLNYNLKIKTIWVIGSLSENRLEDLAFNLKHYSYDKNEKTFRPLDGASSHHVLKETAFISGLLNEWGALYSVDKGFRVKIESF